MGVTQPARGLAALQPAVYELCGLTSVHDLPATILHLLGLDHKRLTYRFGGRQVRLTDVHGEVLRDILA